jgi:hypothetical protein
VWCAADVKYKTYAGGPSRDDLNQVLTYSLVYGVDTCMLVYPATASLRGLSIIGLVGPKRVYCYGLDLMAPDMVAEEHLFAQAISALIPNP